MNAGRARPTRQFHRFPLEAEVQLFAGRQQWRSGLLDISLKGLMIERPEDWHGQTGDSFRAEVILESGIRIDMSVTAARCGDDQIGFHCNQIDMNSFEHLKRVVELNLGNTDLLGRELENLGPSSP